MICKRTAASGCYADSGYASGSLSVSLRRRSSSSPKYETATRWGLRSPRSPVVQSSASLYESRAYWGSTKAMEVLEDNGHPIAGSLQNTDLKQGRVPLLAGHPHVGNSAFGVCVHEFHFKRRPPRSRFFRILVLQCFKSG